MNILKYGIIGILGALFLITQTFGATVLFPYQGGSGTSTVPTLGQLLIGNSLGLYGVGSLAAGSNISISTATNTITISTTGLSNTNDWLKESNFGVLTLTASTSIPYWAKQSIYASSTLITSDRVGIATSTSDRMLSVQGNALFSGDLLLANITASGTATTTNIRISDTLTIGGDNITELVGTGLTLSGSTLTTSLGTSVDLGSAEVTGTLLVANGGTGSTTLGGILLGSGTSLSSTGTVAVAWGGTGGGSFTLNSILVGNNNGALIASTTLGDDVISDGLTLTNITQITNRAISDTSGTLLVGRGGTGGTTFTAGQLLYGGGTATFSSVATTSVSCTGNTTCTGFTVIGASPIVIDSTGGAGTGNVSTSTNETSGNLAYWTSNSATPATLGLVATSSLAVGASLTTTGTLGSQVGGSALTISLNLGNANTWTALQTFANASSTNISSTRGVQLATSGGQVGIGTTTSSASLSVQGNALISGNLTSVANIIATGTVGIGTTSPPTLGVQGNLLVSGTSTMGSLNVASSSVTLNGVSYVLPSDNGTADQALTTNGSGVLSWATAGGSAATWELCGDTHASAATATITVSFAARKNLHVILDAAGVSANSESRMRFNGDTAANYGSKVQVDDGAYTTDQATGILAISSTGATPRKIWMDISNSSTTRKTAQWTGTKENATANNAPLYIQGHGQWDNSANQITQISVHNDSGTTYSAGSFMSVYCSSD